MYNISKKYSSGFAFFSKLLIIAGAYYIIAGKVMQDGHWIGIFEAAGASGSSITELVLIPVILLSSILNWTLEAWKWRELVASFRRIPLLSAARQSFASLTVSLITPNRIGEYGAKALFFERPERTGVLLLNFVSNFSQMAITLLFGLLGSILLPEVIPGLFNHQTAPVLLVAIAVPLAGLLFLQSRKGSQLLRGWRQNLWSIPQAVLTRAFLLSFAKYLVFSNQFYLLLWLFGAGIDYAQAMPVIFSMYFISSLIPGFVLFDWLVKGSVAVSLFQFFGVNEILVLSVTSLMWILNFALPSLIGSYFVLTFKKGSLVLKKSEVGP